MKQQLLKRPLLLVFLLMAGMAVWAQIPANYYKTAEGKTGQDLRAALHNIIKKHTEKNYSELKYIYPDTDGDSDGKLIDIYSSKRWNIDEDGSYSKEGDAWNKEHLWCQSWFGSGTPKSDLFHVMPVDGYVNGRRSNHPFAEVVYHAGQKNNYRSSNGSTLGTSITEGYSGVAFEPADEYKGDVARSMFYMSTRYYTEDGSWSSSEMTNKCEIEPWAMKMLLKWHKDDPVSEKEIARNNKIYDDYQHNRNPFIDHPEYANMIWDENWTETPSHNITCATNLANGSVSAPATAFEGSTVAITATPKPGYLVSSYSAWKTKSDDNDTNTPVDVSINGTFIMPEFDVTVSATFKLNTTLYNIALQQPAAGGTIAASATQALSGTIVTLTAMPDDGYELTEWYVYRTGDTNTSVAVENGQFTMPAYDVTITASFAEPSNIVYEKVTTAPDDWSGQYLIVCEAHNKAFNGNVENDWGRCSNVTINNNTIECNTTTETYEVTISEKDTGYQFLLPSGKYMSWTGEKKFSEGTTAVAYSLSLTNGNVNIVYGDYQVKYNDNQGNGGLRSYKSTSNSNTIKPVQLYKKTGETTVPTFTITFHNGTDTPVTQTVKEFTPTQLIDNPFTNEGYAFMGWNTDENGQGDFYGDGTTVTLLRDLDLYAQWEKLYNVTCAQTEGGSVEASLAEAIEGDIVTLTAEANDNYVFYEWNVTAANGTTVSVTADEFEMPASDVTVSATFVYVGSTGGSYYEKVTTEPSDWSDDYLIVYEDGSLAFNGALETLDAVSNTVAATISNGVIASTESVDAAIFTIQSMGDNKYSICSASGSYIGKSKDDNGLDTNTEEKLMNTISMNSDGTINIIGSGGAYLRFNSTSGQTRFRYYKSGTYTGQKAITLYRKIDDSAEPLVLANDDSNRIESNADLLTAAADAGKKVNVVLYGRTLFKDKSWNTLCLPFDVDIEGSSLDGATLKELQSASVSGTTLTMNFAEAQAVEANKPYLVKWTSGTNIVDPLFEGVTIARDVEPVPTAFTDGSGEFVGTYQSVTLVAGDRTVLYLGNNNNVYYPASDLTLGAFRAYFRLLNGYHAGTQSSPTRIVLNFDDDADVTGISDVQLSNVQSYYDLQGRRVKQPIKGVYMMNGRKLVVK